MAKHYIASRANTQEPLATGWPKSMIEQVAIANGMHLVTLRNNATPPARFKFLGQSPDAGKLMVSDSMRAMLTTELGLTEAPRGKRLGKVLFEAKTIGSPADSDTLEPSGINVNLWLNGRVLWRERFSRSEEFAQKIIAKKRSGYARLRATNLARARKWLYKQTVALGFDRADIQGEHLSDGPPLLPSTTLTETGTPDLTWVGSGSAYITWDNPGWTSDASYQSYQGMCPNVGVSDGDMKASIVMDGAKATTHGACVRLESAMASSGHMYLMRQSGDLIYLIESTTNNFGQNWNTIATEDIGVSSPDGNLEMWLQVEGSDLTMSLTDDNGTFAYGPYTDSAVPDTHLFGAVNWHEPTPSYAQGWVSFELTDELAGAGEVGLLDPTVLKPCWVDGANLKPSMVTPAYGGGVPSAASEVKAGLLGAGGSLKAGLCNAEHTDLKPSMKA